MIYWGYGVLYIFICCWFFFIYSIGQQFIYSGCFIGKVVVYDFFSGYIVKKLMNYKVCVCDVSWYFFEEKIVSSLWDGNLCLW